ncbi:hypothetical protein C1I95_34220, partial [Micromonospora craterilacus]
MTTISEPQHPGATVTDREGDQWARGADGRWRLSEDGISVSWADLDAGYGPLTETKRRPGRP